MKKLLLLALIAFFHAAFAQPTTRLIQAEIQTVKTKKPGIWQLTLQAPADQLSLKDSIGFVTGLYSSSPYRNHNLSAVSIETISAKTITASAETFDEIKPGDVVLLSNPITKPSYSGKLFNIAVNGIFINAPDGQSYYAWAQIVSGSKAWEDPVMAKMLADVKKASINFNDPIEVGVDKGKKTGEVMALATAATVQIFLTSCEQVPQIYFGRTLNLTEEYAKWVQSGSIDYSIMNQFIKALAKDSDFENLKKNQSANITRDFLINHSNGANVLYSAGGSADSYVNTLKVASKLSPTVLSGDDLGYVHFSAGSAFDISEDYTGSLNQYVLAGKAYQGTNEIQYARSISRQAESTKMLGGYKKGGDLFEQGIALWRQAISKNPSIYNYSRLRISLEGVATCATETEQHEKYIAAYQELAGIYNRLNLKRERGNAFWNIAYTYGSTLGQSVPSNQYYEKAYQVFDSIKNVMNAVTVLCNQAINFRTSKDYKSALEMGMRAEAYAKANLNGAAEGYALNNIMATYKADGKNEKALETARKMEKLYTTLGLTKKLAETEDEIASIANDLSKTDEAAKAGEDALKLYQQFATGKDLADAYWNAGYYMGTKSDRMEVANGYYRKAYEYFQDHNTKSATTLLSNIAVNYRYAEDKDNCYLIHTEAFQYAASKKDTTAIIGSLEKLYYSCVHFGDHTETGEVGLSVARLYYLQGDDAKSREFCSTIISSMNDVIALNDGHKSIASLIKSQVYTFQGDNPLDAANMMYNAGYYHSEPLSSLGYYKKSLVLYKALDDAYNQADNHNALAKTYKSLQYYDSAKMEVEKGLALAQKINREDLVAQLYNTKAQIFEVQNQFEEALKWYGKAELLGELTNKMTTKENMAKLYNKMKRYDLAAQKHKERLDLDPKDGTYLQSDIFWSLGYSLSFIPSRLKESNDYYSKASTYYKKNKEWENFVTVNDNIGINYRDAEDSVNCYKVYREVIATVKPKLPSDANAENYYKALENFGFALKHFNHHSQALRVRLQAAEGYELLQNKEKAYSLYKSAGESADAAKKYLLAEKYYLKARDIAASLNDKAKLGSIIWSIAYNKGTYQLKSAEAMPLWEEAYNNFLEAGDTANASIMRSNVGQESWTMLDFDKAIENHTKAIEIATKGKYLTQVAYSWRKLADLYSKTQNPLKQSEATHNAIKMLEILKDTTELLPAYFDLGYSYGESHETAKAEEFFNKALDIAKAKKDSSNIAMAYYKFAGLYHSKLPSQAMRYYEKAIPIQRRLKESSNLIYSLASYASLTNQPEPINEALRIAEQLQDENIIAYCHGRLYNQYRDDGKPDIAHKHMDKSISIYKKLDYRTSLVNNYIAYANEYLYDYGDFTKSQKYMADARALLDSTTSPLTLADFHSQQSSVYADQGQHDLALAELDNAQDIYEGLHNEWGLASLYISYGNIYKGLGEYAMAMKYQSKSDSLYDALNLQYPRMAPICNIGDVYFEQGDYPKALEYFHRSLKLIEDNKDQNTNLCKLLSAVGVTYSYMTNYAEAEKWLMKGLETSKKISATRVGADILNYLGKLKIETKKYDEAERFLLEAKTFLVAQNLMVERTSNAIHLGHLYLMKGDLEKAKAELTEGITLAENFGKDAVLWEGYYRMGIYYRKSGNQKEAKAYLLKAVGVIDKLRSKIVGGEEAQKLFSSDKWILEAYEELISVLLEQGETEEAMAWLQKINENNTRDKMRSLEVTFEDEEKNKALAREKEMKLKLDALEKQIAAQKQSKVQNAEQIKNLENIRNIAEGDYLKFVNQTVNVQPELQKYFSNTVQPSQLKGKKKSIPKDMALVSYLVGEKQLYIFVATSDTVVARIVSVTKEKIHRDVNAMMNITKSHLGDFGTIDLKTQEAERKEVVKTNTQTDQMLKPFEDGYNYLISPISELIANKSRLGIIPTGELNYIPFQMLGKTLSNKKFSMLINQYSMFYTNSTDMLLRTITAEDKVMNILAFGNPDKTLPATEKEVNDIKKIFPNTVVYVQNEASEDKAKYASEEFNVMHFATHGNLDYEEFSKSYLTMAGNAGKNEDGKLTLSELWGMEVMSHLNIVVLSACQTAVTKGSDESSPVSPATGFLQNGVKSVVATLWKVDDEATSILMNEFYKNIKTMDAVDAMRAAQSTLSNNPKFSHPYYWAAMVLIGDWR